MRPAQQSMRALANERRRRLMELLRHGEKSVTELASEFDIARPAVSRHLRVLREAGIVQYRSDHNIRYYSLRQPEIERLRETLDESFQGYWMPQGSDGHADPVEGFERSIRPFFEVHVSTLVATSPERAYGYCTDDEMFRSWTGEESENSGSPGGEFSAVSAFGGRLVGEFAAMAPPHFLAIRMLVPIPKADNLYTIEFTAEDDGTRIDLRHFVADAEVAKLLLSTWTDTFAVLRDHVVEVGE